MVTHGRGDVHHLLDLVLDRVLRMPAAFFLGLAGLCGWAFFNTTFLWFFFATLTGMGALAACPVVVELLVVELDVVVEEPWPTVVPEPPVEPVPVEPLPVEPLPVEPPAGRTAAIGPAAGWTRCRWTGWCPARCWGVGQAVGQRGGDGEVAGIAEGGEGRHLPDWGCPR